MNVFSCPDCGNDLYFENLSCTCGSAVGFDPEADVFRTGVPFCANRQGIQCNWIAAPGASLCASCAMTSVRPDLAVPGNERLWARAEQAKRRVLAGLRRWGWFGSGDAGPRPEFHMLSEVTSAGRSRVIMGHASGLVTINLAESDTTERVRRREQLGEPYRTLVGHFRHEIAHFLFVRLVGSRDFLGGFRSLFGDETADYGAALARHYKAGPPPDWQSAHISAYASAHPHEDWAESAAHALHLVDLVASFRSAGLSLRNSPETVRDAYAEPVAENLLGAGLEIGVALNHVSRSMGVADLYPFVTTPRVREKLTFAHRWLRRDNGDG